MPKLTVLRQHLLPTLRFSGLARVGPVRTLRVLAFFSIAALFPLVLVSSPGLARSNRTVEWENDSVIGEIAESAWREERREEETILTDAGIVDGVDPTQAITIGHLDIPVDQLSLLVRPLSADELEVEAAAWFTILRYKIQAISQAEVAIKLENQATAEEEYAKQLLDTARSSIVIAQARLEMHEPGSRSHRRALQQFEESIKKIYLAKDAIHVAIETMHRFHEDPVLEAQLERARATYRYAAIQRLFTLILDVRSRHEAGSPIHQELSEQIDFFDKSFQKLEDLERRKRDVLPRSSTYFDLGSVIK